MSIRMRSMPVNAKLWKDAMGHPESSAKINSYYTRAQRGLYRVATLETRLTVVRRRVEPLLSWSEIGRRKAGSLKSSAGSSVFNPRFEPIQIGELSPYFYRHVRDGLGDAVGIIRMVEVGAYIFIHHRDQQAQLR